MQPIPYQSTLQDLSFLIPKSPSAGDLMAQGAQTAATWQQISNSGADQVLQERAANRQDRQLDLQAERQRQEMALRQILLPLEVQKSQTELALLSNDLNKAQFGLKQAQDAATREQEVRSIGSAAAQFYQDPANANKEFPLPSNASPEAVSTVDNVKRSIRGQYIVDAEQKTKASAIIRLKEDGIFAAESGYILSPEQWEQPEVRKQYWVQVQLGKMQKEINAMKNGLGVDVSTLPEYQQILSDPTNYGVEGQLNQPALERLKAAALRETNKVQTEQDLAKQKAIAERTYVNTSMKEAGATARTEMTVTGKKELEEVRAENRMERDEKKAEHDKEILKLKEKMRSERSLSPQDLARLRTSIEEGVNKDMMIPPTQKAAEISKRFGAALVDIESQGDAPAEATTGKPNPILPVKGGAVGSDFGFLFQ